MIRCALIFLGLLLFGPLADARPGPDSNYNQSVVSGGGGGYTGPGDVVASAGAWWGLRGYSAAYSTGSNPAAVVCDTATFAICSTINVLSNGNFDVATASGSPACATACVVKSFTDQTGGGHTASCASAAACGTLTFSCVGALPCIACAAACNYAATVTNMSQPFTWASEFKYTSTATGGVAGSSTTGNSGLEPQSTHLQYFSASPVNVTSAVNTQYDMSVVFNGATSASNLNGSSTTGTNAGTAGYGGTGFTLGKDLFNSYTGQLEEFGMWNISFTPTQQTNMHANLSAYW